MTPLEKALRKQNRCNMKEFIEILQCFLFIILFAIGLTVYASGFLLADLIVDWIFKIKERKKK